MPISHAPPPTPTPPAPFPLGAVFPPELLIKIIRMAVEPETPWHATDLVRTFRPRVFLRRWMRVSRTWKELVEPIWLERIEIKHPAAAQSLLSRVERDPSIGEMVRTVLIGPPVGQDTVQCDWEMDWVNGAVPRSVRCFPKLSQVEIFASRPPGEAPLIRPSALIRDSLGGVKLLGSQRLTCSDRFTQQTSPLCGSESSTSAQTQMSSSTFEPSASKDPD